MVAQLEPARTNSYKVDMEAFSLHGEVTNLHYEVDDDLNVTCQRALGGGVRAGLVLIELGIDGYETHRARVGLHPIVDDPEALSYRSNVEALDDAIEALQAIREQLSRVENIDGERNAFDLGADAQRLGLLR